MQETTEQPATTQARALLRPSGGLPKMGFSVPRTAAEAHELEDLGAASLWVGGHIASPNPTPEAKVWLARAVEQTRRVLIGTATLLLPLYPPGIVAKQVADLDRAAKGRIALGIGVGGEYASDFAACEVPIDERGPRTDECIELLRRFWTAEPVTFEGRFHRYEDVRIHPAPLQAGGPPIIVTGRQPVAMKRAARVGDGWMPYLYSPERYARSVALVREEAERLGRDLSGFSWLAFVFVSMDDDRAAARNAAVGFLGGTYRQDFDAMIDRVAVTGTPEEVTERLAGFVAAGAEHLICVTVDQSVEAAGRLLHDVLPHLSLPGVGVR